MIRDRMRTAAAQVVLVLALVVILFGVCYYG